MPHINPKYDFLQFYIHSSILHDRPSEAIDVLHILRDVDPLNLGFQTPVLHSRHMKILLRIRSNKSLLNLLSLLYSANTFWDASVPFFGGMSESPVVDAALNLDAGEQFCAYAHLVEPFSAPDVCRSRLLPQDSRPVKELRALYYGACTP